NQPGTMRSAGKPAASSPSRSRPAASPGWRPRRSSSSRSRMRSNAGTAAAVAGRGQHAEPPAVHRQIEDGARHRLHAVSVVGVIEEHAEGVLIVKVEAPWGLEEIVAEGAQPLADVLHL